MSELVDYYNYVPGCTVRLWSEEGARRKASQAIDLDVVLTNFTDTAWDLRLVEHETYGRTIQETCIFCFVYQIYKCIA